MDFFLQLLLVLLIQDIKALVLLSYLLIRIFFSFLLLSDADRMLMRSRNWLVLSYSLFLLFIWKALLHSMGSGSLSSKPWLSFISVAYHLLLLLFGRVIMDCSWRRPLSGKSRFGIDCADLHFLFDYYWSYLTFNWSKTCHRSGIFWLFILLKTWSSRKILRCKFIRLASSHDQRTIILIIWFTLFIINWFLINFQLILFLKLNSRTSLSLSDLSLLCVWITFWHTDLIQLLGCSCIGWESFPEVLVFRCLRSLLICLFFPLLTSCSGYSGCSMHSTGLLTWRSLSYCRFTTNLLINRMFN